MDDDGSEQFEDFFWDIQGYQAALLDYQLADQVVEAPGLWALGSHTDHYVGQKQVSGFGFGLGIENDIQRNLDEEECH